MNLMEQCSQWHDEHQHKKIIDAIEAIPEHARTDEQIMELARAYNNYGIEADPSYFEKALALLRPLSAKMRPKPLYWLRFGFALLHTGSVALGLDAFLIALRLIGPSEQDKALRASLTELAHMCYERLGDLREFESFHSKVKRTWASLKNIRDEVYEAMSKAEDNMALASVGIQKLYSSFAVEKNFSISFDKDSKKVIISLECGGSKEDLYQLSYFISQRPKNFFGTDSWEFNVSNKPVKKAAMRNSVFTIAADTVKLVVSTGKRSTRFVDLRVFAPSVAIYLDDAVRGPVAIESIKGLIGYTLGDVCRMALIDNITVVKDENELTNVADYNESIGVVTLSELHEKLTEAGYNTAITADEYLSQSFLSYDFNGFDKRYQPMRFDTYIGSTSTDTLIHEYFHYTHTKFANLLYDGTVAGFFGFKLSDAISEDAMPQEIIAIRERCEDFFKKYEELPVQFTGGATGVSYCYIDFLNYQYCDSFIEIAKEFFESESSVSEAFYAPMCSGVKATVLKGPLELANEFTDGIDDFVLGKGIADLI